ncbi:sugar-binding transcriptional regulator [Propionispira raffinosivorans]|jgi:deoxyribonucleoside regulator|uniref:sugar-binding transcriptional regulator n=1 Tax=Propionispira raffinosivorans TaxID=86959 RepID=UPI0003773DA4|nr:sugar-binding domain-containing protein [Propionispira raffinosivorans]
MQKQKHDEIEVLRTIAKLYYKDNFTQSQIATRYGLSRPKVSRLLTESRKTGIVKIFIADEVDIEEELQEQLLQKYHLKAVRVVSIPNDDKSLAQQITAQEAAKFMVNLLEAGDIVGVSWGYTIYTIARAFPTLTLPNIELVQLSGNLDNVNRASRADEILGILSQKLHAENAYTFPCPAMVDNEIILDTMLHDNRIRKVFDKAQNCNKAIVNIAAIDENDCLLKGGYIDNKKLEQLMNKQVAGRICCHYINTNGDVCDENLDRRTMGVKLEELKKKRFVMTCITSEKKLKPLVAALKGEYINVLVIDSICAEKLLEEY